MGLDSTEILRTIGIVLDMDFTCPAMKHEFPVLSCSCQVLAYQPIIVHTTCRVDLSGELVPWTVVPACYSCLAAGHILEGGKGGSEISTECSIDAKFQQQIS